MMPKAVNDSTATSESEHRPLRIPAANARLDCLILREVLGRFCQSLDKLKEQLTFFDSHLSQLWELPTNWQRHLSLKMREAVENLWHFFKTIPPQLESVLQCLNSELANTFQMKAVPFRYCGYNFALRQEQVRRHYKADRRLVREYQQEGLGIGPHEISLVKLERFFQLQVKQDKEIVLILVQGQQSYGLILADEMYEACSVQFVPFQGPDKVPFMDGFGLYQGAPLFLLDPDDFLD